jgi:hypothetical protein
MTIIRRSDNFWNESKSTTIKKTLRAKLQKDLLKPEEHELYEEEWKKFWVMRFKELVRDGRDPSSYDFIPDWIEFWPKRIVELYNEELNAKLTEI